VLLHPLVELLLRDAAHVAATAAWPCRLLSGRATRRSLLLARDRPTRKSKNDDERQCANHRSRHRGCSCWNGAHLSYLLADDDAAAAISDRSMALPILMDPA